MARTTDDGYGKDWIIEHSESIIGDYDQMTVRQLYYRLVSMGMPNTMRHYKRVVSAMESARWDDESPIEFSDFIDREREPYGTTDIDEIDLDGSISWGKLMLVERLSSYRLNKWSNQDNYVVVWIEKKALQGVFESVCSSHDVELFACKGYPSLTALFEASERFENAVENDKNVVILYLGDHDPSGDDIPRSVEENLSRMGVNVTLDRIGLTVPQISELGLPPAPTKKTDSRSRRWSGVGQVELDAVEPSMLVDWVTDAIDRYFDDDKYADLRAQQKKERQQFTNAMVEYVKSGEFDQAVSERYGDD